MSTELALRKLPIRVNSIAPGVYSTEMTGNGVVANQKDTDAIGKPIVSVPAARSGRCYFGFVLCVANLMMNQRNRDGGYRTVHCIPRWRVFEWAGNSH